MTMIEHARLLRKKIEELSVHLDDTEAVGSKELFPTWVVNRTYSIGDRVQYNNDLYKCLQSHTAASNWNPVDAVSLWAKVLIPDPEVIPEWIQPDSTNPYMIGDKVTYNGKTWICTINYNVFEPGVAGWEEVV